MKSLVLTAMLFTGITFAHSQQSPKPAAPPPASAGPVHPGELSTLKISNAMKDYTIAQMQLQQLQTTVSTAREAVLTAVAAAKKELKLDDTYDYDFNTLSFIKKPTPPAPAAK